MKEKILKWSLIGIFIIILAIPIIIDANRRGRVEIISFDQFVEVLYTEEKALVYFGNTEVDNFESIRESLHTLKEEFEIAVYAVNMNDLNPNHRDSIEEFLFEGSSAYVFVRLREFPYIEEGAVTLEGLRTLINRYLFDEISSNEIVYTIPETASEYLEALRGRNNIVMTVFGNDTSQDSRRFEPIFNFLAADYDLNVFYVNLTRMDSDEYRAILDSNLMIPASCIQGAEEDIPISELQSVGLPLTLFTRNGRAFDCLVGVVSRSELKEILVEVGILD